MNLRVSRQRLYADNRRPSPETPPQGEHLWIRRRTWEQLQSIELGRRLELTGRRNARRAGSRRGPRRRQIRWLTELHYSFSKERNAPRGFAALSPCSYTGTLQDFISNHIPTTSQVSFFTFLQSPLKSLS